MIFKGMDSAFLLRIVQMASGFNILHDTPVVTLVMCWPGTMEVVSLNLLASEISLWLLYHRNWQKKQEINAPIW